MQGTFVVVSLMASYLTPLWSSPRGYRFLKRQGEGREIPRLFALSAAKYFGYALGKRYRLLPKWLRARCTMNRSYWEKCA